MNGKPGRRPATGRFNTREDLERFIHVMADTALQKDIAQLAGVSIATVSNITQPHKQRQVVLFRRVHQRR